jgi:hypothetical protein
VIEVWLDSDLWHKAVETSGYWRPFGMLFADAPLSIDLEVDLLVFSQLGNKDIFVNEADL